MQITKPTHMRIAIFLALLSAGCSEMMTPDGGAGGGSKLRQLVKSFNSKDTSFAANLAHDAPVDARESITDIAPLLTHQEGAGKNTTTHALGPLLSYSSTAEARAFALRPLFAFDSRPGYMRSTFLWPLVNYTRRGKTKTLSVLPVFFYKSLVTGSGGNEQTNTDWFAFPLLFGGSDSKRGKYFAFFPFGGQIKGFLGKRSIKFALWPLWTKTVDQQYTSVSIGFPTLSYWQGKRQHGRKLWPFYSADIKKDAFDRRTYLWPFVHVWKNGLGSRRPGETIFVFPFYGQTKNYVVDKNKKRHLHFVQRTWLFPFFQDIRRYRLDKSLGGRTRNIHEMQMPYPFLAIEKGDGLEVRKLWPIWGERKSNDRRDKFFAWPIFRRSVYHLEDAEHRWTNVALLFSRRTETWIEDKDGKRLPPAWPTDFKRLKDERLKLGLHENWPTASDKLKEGSKLRSRSYTQLWPLFHHKRDEQGNVSFQTLSLLPTNSKRADAIWRPWFTLLSYQRDITHQQRTSMFFGLYRHIRRAEGKGDIGMRHVNFAGLVSYSRRTNIDKRFSLLGGLFGYERVGTKKRFKFLWIPFGRIPDDLRKNTEEAAIKAARSKKK